MLGRFRVVSGGRRWLSSGMFGNIGGGAVRNVVGPTAGSSTGGLKAGGKNEIKTVKYVLNCLFTKNNTHFTYSAVVDDGSAAGTANYNDAYLKYLQLPYKVKFHVSTGQLGFRKAARGEYEAGFQTASKVFDMMQERRLLDKDVEIVMRDFGKGRHAFVTALNGKEGTNIRRHVVRVSDKTPLKFGGVRSPRVRRL